MKPNDYNKLIELRNAVGGFMPVNSNAIELLDRTSKGEVITLREVTSRDVKFHRSYFALLGFIYSYLPKSFKERISPDGFYRFIKHLMGEYKVIHTFKDGSQLIDYTSIAFGNMSQKDFEEYVANQLPFIYSNILGAYFELDILNAIIYNIENEFEKLLKRLP